MRCLVAFLLALVVSVAYSQPVKTQAPEGSGTAKHDPTTNAQKSDKASNKNPPSGQISPPASVDAKPPVRKQFAPEIRDRQSQITEEELQAQKDQATFALYLVWVGAITGVLLILQLVFTGMAAKAATDAANAAFLQAQSIKGSERARIFFTVAYERMDRLETSGNIPRVKITAINHGKTVATITKIKAHLFAHPSVPTELPKLADAEKTIPDGFGIAPSGIYEFHPRTHLDTFKSSDEWKLDVVWYCAGEFTYRDIFGDIHVTGFCWECEQKNGEGRNVIFRFCVNSTLNYQT